MTITAKQTAEILELAERATPGPWHRTDRSGVQNQSIESADVVQTDNPNFTVSSVFITAWKKDRRDARPTAEFIARARTALPEYAKAYREAMELLDRIFPMTSEGRRMMTLNDDIAGRAAIKLLAAYHAQEKAK